MGVSLTNIHNNAGFALKRHAAAMAILQEHAATGSVINRPSDNPTDAYKILGLATQKRYLDNYMEGISTTIDILNMSLNAADAIKMDLVKVKEEIMHVGGADGGTGQIINAELINSKLEDAVAWVNSQHLDQYLFSGSSTATAPYAVVRDSNGKISSVTYQGSFVDRKIEVASGVESSAFIIGDDIFRLQDPQSPVFTSEIGTAAGTGTSSVSGFTKLTVEQDTDPGKYKLSIDGINWVTVDKGKGAEVQDFAADAAATGTFTLTYDGQTTSAIPHGADATTIQAALEALSGVNSGEITVTGTLTTGQTFTFLDTMGDVNSITIGTSGLADSGLADGQAATETIAGIGNDNLAVTDSNGKVLYVDTTAITGTGETWVNIPGSYDVFNTLISIRDRFENVGSLNSNQVAKLVSDSMAALDESVNRLTKNSVSTGSKIGFLDDIRIGLDDTKFNTETEAANLEDVDIAQVAIDLSRREVLYQMSMAIAGRMLSMSLLDFI